MRAEQRRSLALSIMWRREAGLSAQRGGARLADGAWPEEGAELVWPRGGAREEA